jgi:hypothetical protein
LEVPPVKYLAWLPILTTLAWAPTASADQVNVGDIFFLDLGNGTTQFYLDNLTGTTDGCSTPGGFPVCADLLISGTLTYSYFNGSNTVDGAAILAAPIGTDAQNGGTSYAPANFLLPSTDILSASFSGSLSPVDFTTDIGSFDSDGTVVSATDVVAGGGYALLVTASPSTAPIPEPSSIAFLLLGSLALLRSMRQRRF